MEQQLFAGYVELRGGDGLHWVEFYKNEAGEVDVWVNGDLADHVYSAEGFKDHYGLKLYKTLEDFKRGNSIDVFKVWT